MLVYRQKYTSLQMFEDLPRNSGFHMDIVYATLKYADD